MKSDGDDHHTAPNRDIHVRRHRDERHVTIDHRSQDDDVNSSQRDTHAARRHRDERHVTIDHRSQDDDVNSSHHDTCAETWKHDRHDTRASEVEFDEQPSDSGLDEDDRISQMITSEYRFAQNPSMRIFAKRPTQVAQIENAHLPLHVQNPAVPMLSWEIADSIMKTAANDSDERVWFETTNAYRNVSSAESIFEQRDATQEVFDDALLFNDDLEKLIASGFAIETGMTPNEFEKHYNKQCAYVKLFSVVESKPEGERRRVIAWPRSLNAAERKVTQRLRELKHARVRFDSAKQVRDRGVRCAYSASLDFKKFFQQFALIVKHFWAFKYRNKVYFLATIPTGGVFPPTFANALSRTMLSLGIRVANVESLVEQDCCIDNLRLCSDNLDALWAAWHELLHICKSLGATIGEINPPPMRIQNPYVYLGVRFSTQEEFQIAELSPKSKLKLQKAIHTLRSEQVFLAVDVIALFGQTVWASTVTGYRLGNIYHVIKFIRRVQRHDMNDFVNVWPSIVDGWIDALKFMMNEKFRATPITKCNATMYTDSSDDGWGIVLLDYGSRSIRIFAGKWSPEEKKLHINVKELMVIRIGIRIIPTIIDHTVSFPISLCVKIDNTTARSWALRKRAPNYIANSVACEIDDEAKNAQIIISDIDYVRSEQNISDAPSRRFSNTQDNCVRQ